MPLKAEKGIIRLGIAHSASVRSVAAGIIRTASSKDTSAKTPWGLLSRESRKQLPLSVSGLLIIPALTK